MPPPAINLPRTARYSNQNSEFADAERQRQVVEQQARIEAAKKHPQPQNTPGSGVIGGPSGLSRPAGFAGQLNFRPFDPYAHMAAVGGQQGPTASGATIDVPATVQRIQPSTQPDALAGSRSGTERGIMADPYDWRGKVGAANAPAMDAGWQNRGTGREGAVIPDTARNYKGEKSYFDPYAGGTTYDVDPSKDQRFAKLNPSTGQLETSGANTAAGIAAKYGVPGTTSSFTPAAPAPVAPAGPPQTPERAALYAAHPEIFQEGTPQNIAFVNHVNDYGEASAHQNIDGLMGAASTPPPVAAPATPTASTTPMYSTIAKNSVANPARPKQIDQY